MGRLIQFLPTHTLGRSQRTCRPWSGPMWHTWLKFVGIDISRDFLSAGRLKRKSQLRADYRFQSLSLKFSKTSYYTEAETFIWGGCIIAKQYIFHILYVVNLQAYKSEQFLIFLQEMKTTIACCLNSKFFNKHHKD